MHMFDANFYKWVLVTVLARNLLKLMTKGQGHGVCDFHFPFIFFLLIFLLWISVFCSLINVKYWILFYYDPCMINFLNVSFFPHFIIHFCNQYFATKKVNYHSCNLFVCNSRYKANHIRINPCLFSDFFYVPTWPLIPNILPTR